LAQHLICTIVLDGKFSVKEDCYLSILDHFDTDTKKESFYEKVSLSIRFNIRIYGVNRRRRPNC
jgi:hypothetical protein